MSDKDELISPQNISEFVFIEGSMKALEEARKNNINIYVITNQPDVSKSWRPLNITALNEINMELKQLGIKDIYSCTHGPIGNKKHKTYTDKKGNIKVCNCRKPQPGLIKECFNDYSINIENTIIVGDSDTDMIAATRFEKRKNKQFYLKIKLGDENELCDKSFENLKEVIEAEL